MGHDRLAFSWARLLFADAATAFQKRSLHRGDLEVLRAFLFRDIARDYSNFIIPIVLLIQFVDVEGPLLNRHNKAFIGPTSECACKRFCGTFPAPRPRYPYPFRRSRGGWEASPHWAKAALSSSSVVIMVASNLIKHCLNISLVGLSDVMRYVCYWSRVALAHYTLIEVLFD